MRATLFEKKRAIARALRRGASAALAALLVLGISSAVAQQGVIAGTVTDGATLEPLVGAQVFLEGTDVGTLTDQDGRYRIENVPAGAVNVSVRLIGYRPLTRTVQVSAGQVTNADFGVDVAAVVLDEIVTTITGDKRRREIGYSTGNVDAEQVVAEAKPLSVTDLLKGRVSGVTVRRNSGSLGTGSDIRIRGTASISQDVTPLLVVDGAFVSNDNNTGPLLGGQDASRLNDINPEDIADIEIIKGPAAAALFGSRAAAGVIQITTKKGRAGTTRWNIRADVGSEWDDTDFSPSAFNPRGLGGPFAAATDTVYTLNLLEGDAGFDPPFRTGLHQKYAGSVRGGGSTFSYFVSGQYQNMEGTLPDNELEGVNVRANFTVTPSDKVDISVSNGFVTNSTLFPQNDNNAGGYIGVAMIAFPWLRPITVDDPIAGQSVDTCPLNWEFARLAGISVADATAALGACPENPFFSRRTFDDISTQIDEQEIERYTGSGTLTWRPVPQWSNRVTIGYDQFSDIVNQITPVEPNRRPFGSASDGAITNNQATSRNLTLEGTSTYTIDVGDDWTFETTAGAQFFRTQVEGVQTTGSVFPAGSPTVGNSVTTTATDFTIETRTVGLFAQEQIGYKDRLFITPAFRADDNSAAGENLGVQYYPRLAIAYTLSEEDWFPDAFESFKLRGSYGEAGQQPGSNAALELLNPTRVAVGSSDLVGVTPAQFGNPVLEPARSKEFELGFDATAIGGRLGIEFTAFDSKTENDVVFRQLAPSVGNPGGQFVNVGEIQNRGLELGLDFAALQSENLSWEWRFTGSRIDNEVTVLEDDIIFGLGGASQRHTEGFAFASYFSETFEVDENGTVSVVTCDEDPSGGCDPSDNHRFVGQPTPEWEGSLSTTINLLDHITLYGLLDFQLGHQLFNSTDEFRCGFLGGGPAGGTCLDIFETNADGSFTDEALIKQEAARVGAESPWIEDADFAKLRTVSARFQLPADLVQSLRLSNAALTLVGENLITWTGYTGLDPEINFAGQAGATRADFLTLPPSRRFLASLSFSF